MTDLNELYQSVILDHSRRPRNFGPLEHATSSAPGRNTLCGDELTVWLAVEDDVIRDVHFVGQGCAISKASASLMTQAVKGKTRAETQALFERVHAMLTGRDADAAKGGPSGPLGSLAALSGVSRFPVRVKCASLAWHTLMAALGDAPTTAPVSTE
jgi:nitrogen fixation protein NifU and related proteins